MPPQNHRKSPHGSDVTSQSNGLSERPSCPRCPSTCRLPHPTASTATRSGRNLHRPGPLPRRVHPVRRVPSTVPFSSAIDRDLSGGRAPKGNRPRGCGPSRYRLSEGRGEVPERSNGAVSKCACVPSWTAPVRTNRVRFSARLPLSDGHRRLPPSRPVLGRPVPISVPISWAPMRV